VFDRSFNGTSFDAHDTRCGAAELCRGATTVRQLQHTRRVVERAQIACSCSCMRACGRKLSCIGMRGCGRKRKGVDENSWQSRQLHRRFQRNTMKAADCVDHTEQHMQGVGWLYGTHCWACLGLDCHEFRMQLQLHALCAIHTSSSFPPLVSCAATV
jgi:hypothetical protein